MLLIKVLRVRMGKVMVLMFMTTVTSMVIAITIMGACVSEAPVHRVRLQGTPPPSPQPAELTVSVCLSESFVGQRCRFVEALFVFKRMYRLGVAVG